MKKKTIALLLACSLAVGAAIGGTMAWLTDKSSEVKNTFSTSDIEVELGESKDLDLKMIPGWTIEKDPKVTVTKGSEACFVFVKIDKSENYSTFLENYEVNTGWQQLKDTSNANVEGVFYQKLTANDLKGNDWTAYVLKCADHKDGCTKDSSCACLGLNGYVKVKTTVTKSDMESLTSEADYPTLTFTAYASQLMKDNATEFTAYEAWQNVQPAQSGESTT